VKRRTGRLVAPVVAALLLMAAVPAGAADPEAADPAVAGEPSPAATEPVETAPTAVATGAPEETGAEPTASPAPSAVPEDATSQDDGSAEDGSTTAEDPAVVDGTASYGGVTVTVPDGWRVVDLVADPAACVRHDIATVYLGPAGDSPTCPATVLGSAPTVHLGDPAAAALPGQVDLTAGEPVVLTSAQLTSGEVVARVAGTSVLVTATLADRADVVAAVLSGLQATPTASRARVATTAAAAALPAPLDRSFTWGNGEGFDACTAPAISTMNAWRSASPYRTVGVYIGGSARGCAQPNLTSDYLRSLATTGWSALPIYVGRQASCSTFTSKITPGAEAQQATEAAQDAVARAQALGLGTGSDIYYDMESYPTGGLCSASVLTYLSVWTQTLHAYGYSSGVYSSVSTGIRDLAQSVGQPGFTPPDKIWIARWTGSASIYGHAPYVADNQWAPYSRVHQYRGGHVETWGGASINIDSNRVETDPRAGSPRGQLDQTTTSNQKITVGGWAFDPDQSGPIIVQVYVDGRYAAMGWASSSRPDVASAYPAAGPNHGYTISAAAGAGAHQVCVYAVNVGPGEATTLGCTTAVVPSSDPFGRIDALATSSGTVTASGWAIDPDTSASLIVQVYVDGQYTAMGRASVSRPDVAAAYPSAGAAHGYSVPATASPGDHTVCVYAVNEGPGASTLLGCGRVTVPSGNPVGQVDSGSTIGGISVSGWALDPDSTESLIVQLYVDGQFRARARADQSRPDVAAAYPGYSAARGYSLSVALPRGEHRACVYAVNVGPGSSTELWCYRFDVR
jgi:hypothetical protein